MKKLIATVITAGAVIALSATAASAGSPTCADTFGWKNHGEHVLTYVNDDDGGAGGGKPAHHSEDPDAPAPGASFCLDVNSPGSHF